jgi:NADH dehydrogenase
MKKVIIVGAGFGGLNVAKSLENENFNVTLIDKTNHHLFQPLLYQVATAGLSPGDIAMPVRSLFRDSANISIIMDEVISVDKEKNKIKLSNSELDFDYLVISTGSKHSYLGNEKWSQIAPGLKTLNDALTIREKIIKSLESAEKEENNILREKYLTFVIIGGGPTGVEMAGAIAEIAKKTMIKDYKNFSPYDTKVFLIEASNRVLNSFNEKLSKEAKKDLQKLGVKVLLNTRVIEIKEGEVITNNQTIKSNTMIWAAGNQVSGLTSGLDVEKDRVGRVIVNFDCSIKNHSNIFVIGDAANFKDGKGNSLPGVAQVAIQQGKFVAEIIKKNLPLENRPKFVYKDRGTMATIGKAKAVAEIKGMKVSGFFAWLLWSLIHVFFLIGFRNRIRVMIEWIYYYFTNNHGTRLIVKD